MANPIYIKIDKCKLVESRVFRRNVNLVRYISKLYRGLFATPAILIFLQPIVPLPPDLQRAGFGGESAGTFGRSLG